MTEVPYVRGDREADLKDTEEALHVLWKAGSIHGALARIDDLGIRTQRMHAACVVVIAQAAHYLLLSDVDAYWKEIPVNLLMRDSWIEIYKRMGGVPSESGSSIEWLQTVKES